MTHGSLFSGIGGFDLGFERARIKTIWQVEIDPFCRKVLERHWPDVQRFEDVRGCSNVNLSTPDIVSGGFPCQDISRAGIDCGAAGLDGERSGLWREMYRIVCEIGPRIVVVENVSALLDGDIGRILSDLAAAGFNAEWRVLRASDFGAPHERERVFIVAYSNKGNGQTRLGTLANRTQQILRGNLPERFPIWLQTADRFVGVDDGLSARAYRCRGESLGNAIVPQIAEWIGRRILACNSIGE